VETREGAVDLSEGVLWTTTTLLHPDRYLEKGEEYDWIEKPNKECTH
jgi:hypothetical protein